MSPVVLSDRLCACGCGEHTSTTAEFRRGHHNRTEEHRLRNGRLWVRDGRSVNKISGYAIVSRNGEARTEHVEVAERALGKPLPSGAEVHHVDEVRSNNVPSNLVICPDHAYHMLLHVRTTALDACGHADWRKCSFCKVWDDPANLKFVGKSRQVFHRLCQQKKNRLRYTRDDKSTITRITP